MKYVLDSSVALKWVLNEPDSPKAIQLRDEYRKQLHELHSPDIFPIEIAHALAKAERQRKMHQGHGKSLLTDVLSTPPVLHPYLSLLARAYDLASAAMVGVYDCLYVVLAEQEKCALLTADGRLLRTFPNRRIISLASLP